MIIHEGSSWCYSGHCKTRSKLFKDNLCFRNMEDNQLNAVERRRLWRQEYDRARRQNPEVREKRNEYSQQWRERNRELGRERDRVRYRLHTRNVSVTCECGGKFSINRRARHDSTLRHQKWLAQQQQQQQNQVDG